MKTRRPLLLPFVPLYATAISVKRMLFGRRPAHHRLMHPVLSVGSLSAGGAGKTPVVEALATLLTRHGYAVDVLSRGYGRTSNRVERVDPQGTARTFGDEPLQLARRMGVPVYVGAYRYAAGLLAEKEIAQDGLTVHLLDDGFQHRRLARNLDVVLLTQEDVEDCLLPAGNLREPLSSLRSADIVVLREEEETSIRAALHGSIDDDFFACIIRRQIEIPSLENGAAQHPLAFCGIARPKNFFHMLQAKNVSLAQTIAFADHHYYQEKDIDRLVDEGLRNGADGFVTTEKDSVRISDPMRSRLETIGPLSIARLTVVFMKEDEVLARIQAAVGLPTA